MDPQLPDQAFLGQAQALAEGFAVVSYLPVPLQACILERLCEKPDDLLSGDYLYDMEVVRDMANAFTYYGLPTRYLYRLVECTPPNSPPDAETRNVDLHALEIEGVLYGLRGGRGWQGIFDAHRDYIVAYDQAYSEADDEDEVAPWLREALPRCQWSKVSFLSPRNTAPDPAVERAMAQWRAEQLHGQTPSANTPTRGLRL